MPAIKLTLKRCMAIIFISAVFCCFLQGDENSPNDQQSVLFSYSLVPSLLMTNVVVIGGGPAENSEAINISVMPSILSIYRPSYRD